MTALIEFSQAFYLVTFDGDQVTACLPHELNTLSLSHADS